MFKKSKKSMELETLGYWIIGVTILVIAIIGYVILRSKGIDALNFVKNLFRFGR